MYYVLDSAGQKYGPADLATLRQWAAEGRVSPHTLIEEAAGGHVVAASAIPDLLDQPATIPPPTASAPPVQTDLAAPSPMQPPSPNTPYSPVAGPGQIHAANLSQAVSSPYVRYDATQDFSRVRNQGQAALICIILSFVTSIFGSWFAVASGVAALVCSIQAKKAGHEKGQIYFNLSIVAIAVSAAAFLIYLIIGVAQAMRG